MLPEASSESSACADDARVLDVGGWAAPVNRADWVIDLMPYETRGALTARRASVRGPDGSTPSDWVIARHLRHTSRGRLTTTSSTSRSARSRSRTCATRSGSARRCPAWPGPGYIEVPSAARRAHLGEPRGWAAVDGSATRTIAGCARCETDELVFLLEGPFASRPAAAFGCRRAGRAGSPMRERVLAHFWEGSLPAREHPAIDRLPVRAAGARRSASASRRAASVPLLAFGARVRACARRPPASARHPQRRAVATAPAARCASRPRASPATAATPAEPRGGARRGRGREQRHGRRAASASAAPAARGRTRRSARSGTPGGTGSRRAAPASCGPSPGNTRAVRAPRRNAASRAGTPRGTRAPRRRTPVARRPAAPGSRTTHPRPAPFRAAGRSHSSKPPTRSNSSRVTNRFAVSHRPTCEVIQIVRSNGPSRDVGIRQHPALNEVGVARAPRRPPPASRGSGTRRRRRTPAREPVDASTPRLRAAAGPRGGCVRTVTGPGAAARASAAVSSVEPSSTTITS